MNKYPALQERRNIGQVHTSTKIDLTPQALEKRMKREKRDQQIQRLGRGFRGFIDVFKTTPIGDTDDPNINRRAGKTLIATTLTALALSGTLSIAEYATPDQKVCVTKSSESEDRWTNISTTARELSNQGVYIAENTQLYAAWDNPDSDQICMIDRTGPLAYVIDRIASSTATNS